MTDQPATMQFILPKSIENEIDNFRSIESEIASTNVSFDFQQSLNEALIVGRMLSEQRTNEQQPQQSVPGRFEFDPLPNVPSTLAPEFEQLPFNPGDKPLEFQPIPNVPDSPVTPAEGHDTVGFPTEQSQNPSSTSSTLLDHDWGAFNQRSQIEPDGASLELDEDDLRYKAILDQYKRFYPDQPGWSKGHSSSSAEQSSSPSADSKIPEQGPTSALQDVLPIVKSGCEAMVKLVEIGTDIQKQLARLIERQDSIRGQQFLDDGTDSELRGGYQNYADEFSRAFDAFRNRSTEESARELGSVRRIF